MESDKYAALAASRAASAAWDHFISTERVEPLLARLIDKEEASTKHPRNDEVGLTSSESTLPDPRNSSVEKYLAQSLAQELSRQTSMALALQAETAYVSLHTATCTPPKVQKQPLPLKSKVTHFLPALLSDITVMTHEKSPDEAIVDQTLYRAKAMARELQSQHSYLRACNAETEFVEATYRTCTKCPPETITMGTLKEQDDVVLIHQDEEAPADQNHPVKNLAVSLTGELLSQHLYISACKAETRFIELTTNKKECKMDTAEDSYISYDEIHTTPLEAMVVPTFHLTSFSPTFVDAVTSTELNVVSTSTCTEAPTCVDTGTCTEPPHPTKEVGCNTIVNCLDVLRRAKEIEELQMLKADHLIIVKQLNEERSQRMVADHLVKIVQSDVSELHQKNVSEVTARLRLENELVDVKAELSYANQQLGEKEQRIKELEESLTGTSLLVRKLEEQNSVSLMNRGGIDYMVQAKLAEGRAREAEQRLELAQAELLQAQTEVRVLLDRVGEATREKTESVSSKVHTQLLQLADEKALSAERRAQDLEREVKALQEQLSKVDTTRGGVVSSSGYGLSYGSTYSPLSSTPSFLSQPAFPSLYPSTSIGGTNSMLGFLSHDKPSYLTPSSLKSHELLSKPSLSSYDYNGTDHLKSHDCSSSPYKVESKSHDYSTISHDPILKSAELKPTDVELPVVSTIASDINLSTSHVNKDPDHMTGKDNSSSSDWSSSDEEPNDPLLPSSHRTLISQWEWRAMNKDTPSSTPSQPTITSSPPKKRRPPTAPKPKHLVATRHNLTFEPPCSFNEPVHSASLVSSKRVKGPQGRRLPVRFSKQVTLFS